MPHFSSFLTNRTVAICSSSSVVVFNQNEYCSHTSKMKKIAWLVEYDDVLWLLLTYRRQHSREHHRYRTVHRVVLVLWWSFSTTTNWIKERKQSSLSLSFVFWPFFKNQNNKNKILLFLASTPNRNEMNKQRKWLCVFPLTNRPFVHSSYLLYVNGCCIDGNNNNNMNDGYSMMMLRIKTSMKLPSFYQFWFFLFHFASFIFKI